MVENNFNTNISTEAQVIIDKGYDIRVTPLPGILRRNDDRGNGLCIIHELFSNNFLIYLTHLFTY